MCGLVAIISKNNSGFFQTQKTMFFQMLVADMFRGLDSTGVYSVNNYGNLKWIKDASSAPFLLQNVDAF
jgi:glucosamine 6-phosphate synthetase-like amidotransferase/phosphosugar isomerase protein